MQPLYEYVCHIKGHRNSKGELAEWVIKSHETGEILSSHKSEKKAKEHLQQMHIFNEAAESAGYPKLYHICGYMTGLTDDDIRDILTNGLRLHDNGEANCIWFSTGTPFSESDSVSRRPLVLSLECTPENIRKYRIDEYDVQANSPIVNVHENIPIEDLKIEQLAWGSIYSGGRQIGDIISTRFYGNFERWARFDKDINIVIYEDLFNMWARDDIARQGFNPDLNRLKEIMGDRLTITNFMEPKSDKLIGESTDGTDMDNRVKIFMEGVSQLGLTSSQVDAIGKLTNACLESELTLPENFTDEDLASRDDLEERRLDQVYDELYKLGVSSDTINDRGRENDFSFNTMYQLLKDVCADKGIPVPKIDGQNNPNDSIGIPSMDFGEFSDDNAELGSMDFGDFGNEDELGEIGKIGEDQEEQPEF